MHSWPVQGVEAQYFHPDSLVDNWGDPAQMQGTLIKALDEARSEAGIPFFITSAYRSESSSSHGRGWGVDVRAHRGRIRWAIVSAAMKVGFNRIGVYDKHIHLDMDPDSPSEVIWSGEST